MSSVIPHIHQIQQKDRVLLKGHQPCVVWLTGLSGSGKSTIADVLEKRLCTQFKAHTYLLDGDNIRTGLNADLTFSAQDRTENIRRVAEVAKLMVDAGLIVITAFISPYRQDRERARALFPEGEFFEVFVDCPLSVCQQRDPKGLYREARAGKIEDFTGINAPYEEPLNAQMVIHSDLVSVDNAVNTIVEYLIANHLLQDAENINSDD